MVYGPVNVTTFVIFSFALWVIFTRMRNRADNNWPVVFYAVVVVFALQLPGRVDPNTIITGVLAALLLRFEFVGGFVAHIVRFVDFVALSAISYNLYESTVY